MDTFDDLSVLTDDLKHRILCIILYNVTSSSILISRLVRELLADYYAFPFKRPGFLRSFEIAKL